MSMNPILKAKLELFRQHRLSYRSLQIFLMICLLALFAPFIANDKPLVVAYKSHLYFPIIHNVPETTFGGEFKTLTNYQDPAVKSLISEHGFMIMPIIPYADQTVNLDIKTAFPAPPSKQNWFGTDDQGRDVLARLIYGVRVSIFFGLGLTLVGSLIGISVGAVQGYFGGKTDLAGQRFIEVWGSLPELFVVMILVSVFTPSIFWLFLILVSFSWMRLEGLVRAEFLRARNFDYVKAAKVLGSSNGNIILRHVLPNSLSSSLSQLPFILTANITALTTLDYLGYGLPPGSPSLGEIMTQAKNNLDAPWLAIAGFVCITGLLSVLVFIGEGARDAFDPRT